MQNCRLAQKVAFTQATHCKGKSLSPVLVERMCFCIRGPRYRKKQTHVHTHFLRLVYFMIKCRQAVLIFTVETINESPAVQ